MFKAGASPYWVGEDRRFRVKDVATRPPGDVLGKKECKRRLAKQIDEISDLQSCAQCSANERGVVFGQTCSHT